MLGKVNIFLLLSSISKDACSSFSLFFPFLEVDLLSVNIFFSAGLKLLAVAYGLRIGFFISSLTLSVKEYKK